MNPKYLEILNKVDVKKTAMYVGGALLLIVLYIYVRKKIMEYKADKKDEEYQRSVGKSIDSSVLTYNDADYLTMANALESYLADTRAGWAGVDEDGIFNIMEKMKNNSDVAKLITAFGKRNLRKRWQTKTDEYDLPSALAYFLDQGERDEIEEIFETNGVTYPLF